jgi:4-hydroxy-tetrahydrodipicolinate synthase
MKALKSSEIYGNWATILLPVEKDDRINYLKLADEIDVLIAAGVNGIYSNGTAGEFYNQTEEEFDKISELLAVKCDQANMPFQIGCSHMSPKISLERLKRVLPLKPGAIQVILPDWYPPSMPEIISYLKLMSDTAFPIGLVLYNPGHAKRKLTPEDFLEIKKAGINLVGCKVGGGDEEWYNKMTTLNPYLSVFIPGHRLATGIKLGAHGSYSNVACLNPKTAQIWYQTMLTDTNAALELQERIQAFFFEYIISYITEKGYSDQAVDKFLAAVGGWGDVGTRLRWPYSWINTEEVNKIQAICKAILPEFFLIKNSEGNG